MKFAKVLSILGALSLAAALSACLNDSGPSSSRNDGEAHLTIKTGVKDVNKTKGLGKASVITLKKLIITLTSSDSTHIVIRDTLIAGVDSGFSSVSTSDQSITRDFAVKPLRSWTVVVKTLDANDSIIHYDSTVASNLLVAESRTLTVNLTSRYVMYEAKFTVPDSLHFALADISQELRVTKVVMSVNDVIKADSVTTPRFTPSTTVPLVTVVHTIRFDYISSADTSTDVKIQFYGSLGADTATILLFEKKFDDIDPNGPTNPPAGPPPTYKGPNSEDLKAGLGIVINIGKVGTVVFQVDVNGNLPKVLAPK